MEPNKFEALEKQVASLREILEGKFSPEKYEEEKQKLFNEVMEKVHPKSRIMKFAPGKVTAETKEVEKLIADGKMPENGVYLGQILKAYGDKDMQFLQDMGLKTVMSEGTAAQGGYTVPIEYSDEIIKLETAASILRRIARIFPMGSLTRYVPRQLTNVTVTWTDEAANKYPTKPTVDRLEQIARKLACVVKFTDELLEDNTVNIDRFVMELVAEAMAAEEDRVGLAGNTGAGDPFMGVLYQAGVNVVTMAGANVTYDDVVDLIMGVNSAYRQGGTLITSTAGLQTLMKVKDSQGRYLWQVPGEGQIPRIWTYPYEISDQIPTNLTVGANNDATAVLFGNFKKYYYVSDRGGYEVYVSRDASDLVTTESAFMSDQTWSRFKKRMALNVALPVAFSRMLIR